mgnify:CR=1 FL=1
MVLLILFTGMRSNEVLALKKEDILDSGTILIRDSKTHTSRTAFLHPEVKEALATYHAQHPNPDNPYVFYPHYGRLTSPLTYTAIRAVVKELFIEAGIYKSGLNLHCLRHTFARCLVESGFRREDIQKLLGHKSLRSTEIYTVLSDQDVLKKAPLVYESIQAYLEESEKLLP